MTWRRVLAIGLALVVMAAAGASIAVAVRRRPLSRPGTSRPAAAAPVPAQPGRKIKAHLYYLSMDGTKLTPVDREVAYSEGAAAQAQEIVAAQLAEVPPPLLSAIPPGTTLRALYLSGKGEAFVDLSHDVSTAHTGGTLDELLTVYTIVDALTTNLPAVTSVQLLVGGKQVETLAGHIDLRRPLEKDLSIVEEPVR